MPTLLLIAFVLYTDRQSKEPTKNVLICILSGILTISLSGFFEQLFMPYFANNTILTYVFAFIEEMSKVSIFFLFILHSKYYDDIYDGIVYMALIALSFAGLENLMYAFSESTVPDSINLAIMRDLTTIPLHVISGIVIGYFLSLGNFAKDKLKKYKNIIVGILLGSIIHGTFNLLMNILGSIDVNNSSKLIIFITQALPLVLIMLSLFLIVYVVTLKTVYLNEIYLNNDKYDGKHSYLMIKSEYFDSEQRKRRINIYNIFSKSRNK